jgi:hypothetical protein
VGTLVRPDLRLLQEGKRALNGSLLAEVGRGNVEG